MSTTIDSLMNNKGAMIVLAVIAFLLAAVLVLAIVRMLVGGRLRMPGGRARQARLGIVDAFDLDRQRQLIIVRRDNTEHLIMIGGPNDILIESEIVRVEARDFREGRRDRADGAPIPGPMVDARIPAPFVVQDRAPPADRAEALQNGANRYGDVPVRTAEEPMLPMTMPLVAPEPQPEPPPAVQRTPTFPLPPRRPPASVERRPPPPLPESASRTEPSLAAPVAQPVPPAPPMPPPVLMPEPPSPEPAPPSPEPPAIQPPAPEPVAPPPQPQEASVPDVPAPPPSPPIAPTPLRQPPPFLKPLPPRPPIRPLRRVTPQAVPPANPPTEPPLVPATPPQVPAPPAHTPPPPAAVEAPVPETVVAEAQVPQATPPKDMVAAPPVETPAPLAAPPPAPPTPAATQKDALESLEEEMAKLLGRGSS